ncbi:MAG: sigma-54 dependent transcriptional regulator, partial [Planctomycetes bacterium]|nr:sigma-54 dependent transcriptional regulator [Planctomycetota bacterium]
MIRVLLVEDERYVAESLVALLRASGIDALPCESGEAALDAAPCDVALVDLRLPGMSGLDLLRHLRERDPSLPVLMLTGHGTITVAVEAMRAGALDFLTKPVEPEVIVARLRKAVERRRIERERDRLRGLDGLVAESENMRAVLRLADQVAAQPGAVLVTGESGTGKELVATYLHERSPRRVGPLVKVSCAAVPKALFEVEFFGCKRGAYTGATRDREGWFAEADGGTLFLDEVGTLPPEGQAKLLRAIESQEIRPVGATEPVRVDVRIVAATNADLKAARDEGRFRADLYYRLAVFEVALPPLRARPEDLLALAARFAAPLKLKPGAQQALRRHPWPGNV